MGFAQQAPNSILKCFNFILLRVYRIWLQNLFSTPRVKWQGRNVWSAQTAWPWEFWLCQRPQKIKHPKWFRHMKLGLAKDSTWEPLNLMPWLNSHLSLLATFSNVTLPDMSPLAFLWWHNKRLFSNRRKDVDFNAFGVCIRIAHLLLLKKMRTISAAAPPHPFRKHKCCNLTQLHGEQWAKSGHPSLSLGLFSWDEICGEPGKKDIDRRACSHMANVCWHASTLASSGLMPPTRMRIWVAPASLRISLVDSFSCCFSTALAARKAGNWPCPRVSGAAPAGTAAAGAVAAASSDMVKREVAEPRWVPNAWGCCGKKAAEPIGHPSCPDAFPVPSALHVKMFG